MIGKLFFIFILLVYSILNAEDSNTSTELTQENTIKIELLEEQIAKIDNGLKNNIWFVGYQNYITYQGLISELEKTDERIKILSRKRDKKSLEEYDETLKLQDGLEKQIELLSEYKNSPFVKIVKPDDLARKPDISNPFMIIPAFSYIKQIDLERTTYKNKIDSLNDLIVKLDEKEILIKNIYDINKNLETEENLNLIKQDILEFNRAYVLAETTFSVYSKKVEQVKLEVTASIKAQMQRAFDIALFVIAVIVISLIFKFFIKRYIKDNERFYTANKVINFINFTLIAIILLFAYIDNVSYFVTILGFASAGIAIAMKDWFMSILGWMVIIFGGSFKVGDRIKVQKDGLTYVGDVIDISLLRMTILEDITLTTYMVNRRSGRVVFIPNNYVFTTLISNYTHGTMKTVWDGIDITITFESNHKKAMHIIKEITKKYSKGYTDIARRSLNKLRNQYSLKNTNVEPRIFSFLEPHGLTISTWYMTNSYASLTLRSTISGEIIDAINKEDNISIAYPTQTIDVRHASKDNMPSHVNMNKDGLV